MHNHRGNPPWAEGRSSTYVYDSEVTARSADMVFEFFAGRAPAAAKQ